KQLGLTRLKTRFIRGIQFLERRTQCHFYIRPEEKNDPGYDLSIGETRNNGSLRIIRVEDCFVASPRFIPHAWQEPRINLDIEFGEPDGRLRRKPGCIEKGLIVRSNARASEKIELLIPPIEVPAKHSEGVGLRNSSCRRV